MNMENVSFSSIHLVCMWKMVLLCLTTSERKKRRFKQMQLGTCKTSSPKHTHDCLNSFKNNNKKTHTFCMCNGKKHTHTTKLQLQISMRQSAEHHTSNEIKPQQCSFTVASTKLNPFDSTFHSFSCSYVNTSLFCGKVY